jgi:hypothetical protein
MAGAIAKPASTGAPAAAETPAAPPVAVPATDELVAAVAEAQGELALAGEAAAMRRDPYRLVLAALSAALGVFLKSVRRWERAVADVIAARDPLSAAERADLVRALVEATKDGAYQATRKEAARMVRTLDRGLAARIGLGVGAPLCSAAR